MPNIITQEQINSVLIELGSDQRPTCFFCKIRGKLAAVLVNKHGICRHSNKQPIQDANKLKAVCHLCFDNAVAVLNQWNSKSPEKTGLLVRVEDLSVEIVDIIAVQMS